MNQSGVTAPSPLTPEQIRFLAVGLAGSLLVGLSAQFPSANIADLQGGLFSTPDEASWVLTVYAMASVVGVDHLGPLHPGAEHRPVHGGERSRVRHHARWRVPPDPISA